MGITIQCLLDIQVTTIFEPINTHGRQAFSHLHDHGSVGQIEELRILCVPDISLSISMLRVASRHIHREPLTTFAILLQACSPVRTWVVRLLAMSGNLIKSVNDAIRNSQHKFASP